MNQRSDDDDYLAPLCRRPGRFFGSHAEVHHDDALARERCTCLCHKREAER